MMANCDDRDMNSQYIVVGVVAIVIGAVFGAVAWTHIAPYQNDRQSAASVEAVILDSSISEGRNAEGQLTYAPNVSYRYEYEGTSYTSHSIFPGDINPVSDRSEAEDIVARYETGEHVTAYVNQNDPSSAFLLDQTAPLWYWLGPLIGIGMILYGVHSIRLGIKGVEPGAANFG
jgi:hypothetical protein